MNSQAVAIVNGAISQLQALGVTQQASIDSDTADMASVQAKVAADQADIAAQTSDLASTNAWVASLQGLLPPATSTAIVPVSDAAPAAAAS